MGYNVVLTGIELEGRIGYVVLDGPFDTCTFTAESMGTSVPIAGVSETIIPGVFNELT